MPNRADTARHQALRHSLSRPCRAGSVPAGVADQRPNGGGRHVLRDRRDEGRRRLRQRTGRAGSGGERLAACAVVRLQRRSGAAAGGPGTAGRHPGLRLAAERLLDDPALRQAPARQSRHQPQRHGRPVPGWRTPGADRRNPPAPGRGVPNVAGEFRQDRRQARRCRRRGAVVRGAAAGRHGARIRQNARKQPAIPDADDAREQADETVLGTVPMVDRQGDGRFRQRDAPRVPRGRSGRRTAPQADRLRRRRGRRDAVRVRRPQRLGDRTRRRREPVAMAAPAPAAGSARRRKGARVPTGEREDRPGLAAPEAPAAVRLSVIGGRGLPPAADGGLGEPGRDAAASANVRERDHGSAGEDHVVQPRHPDDERNACVSVLCEVEPVRRGQAAGGCASAVRHRIGQCQTGGDGDCAQQRHRRLAPDAVRLPGPRLGERAGLGIPGLLRDAGDGHGIGHRHLCAIPPGLPLLRTGKRDGAVRSGLRFAGSASAVEAVRVLCQEGLVSRRREDLPAVCPEDHGADLRRRQAVGCATDHGHADPLPRPTHEAGANRAHGTCRVVEGRRNTLGRGGGLCAGRCAAENGIHDSLRQPHRQPVADRLREPGCGEALPRIKHAVADPIRHHDRIRRYQCRGRGNAVLLRQQPSAGVGIRLRRPRQHGANACFGRQRRGAALDGIGLRFRGRAPSYPVDQCRGPCPESGLGRAAWPADVADGCEWTGDADRLRRLRARSRTDAGMGRRDGIDHLRPMRCLRGGERAPVVLRGRRRHGVRDAGDEIDDHFADRAADGALLRRAGAGDPHRRAVLRWFR